MRLDPLEIRRKKRIVIPSDVNLVVYCRSRNSFVSARVAVAMRCGQIADRCAGTLLLATCCAAPLVLAGPREALVLLILHPSDLNRPGRLQYEIAWPSEHRADGTMRRDPTALLRDPYY